MEQQTIQQQRQQRAQQIINQLKKCAPKVLANYPVDIAYLHGSVAQGRSLPSSDVDIAIVLAQLPPPYQQLTLELEIQAALEDACRLSNIDVRTINHAPLVVQGEIVQMGILLYSLNKERRVAFEVLTRKKYFDYRPRAEQMQRAFLNHIRREGVSRGQSKYHHLYSKQSQKPPR